MPENRKTLFDKYNQRTALNDIRFLYNYVAEEYDSTIPIQWQKRIDKIDEFIVRHIGQVGIAVELGVGTGRLLSRIDAKFRIGLDLSEKMCKEASKRNIETLVGDLRDTPLKSNSIDAVVYGHGSARYTPIDAVAAETARLLKVGGRFGIHLMPTKTLLLRGLIRPWRTEKLFFRNPPKNLPPFPPWILICAIFAQYGLKLEKPLLLRNYKLPRAYLELPRYSSTLLSSHIGMVGVKTANPLTIFDKSVLFFERVRKSVLNL